MEKKKKTNSNTNLLDIKLYDYPIYPKLNQNVKNIAEIKSRKNSVFQLSKFSKHLSRFKNITQAQVIQILSKNKKLRVDIENRIVADYLTDHFDYFNQIKESSKERFLKLISVLNFEIISSNQIIINIGEENNNFYVLFEGTIVVYRQYKYKKDMIFSEFCKILNKAKQNNKAEYNNIIKNNSHLDLNFEEIMNDEYYYLSLKNKIFNFNIQELEEIGKYKEGYYFGELSLINKKNTDIIIKSVTNCKLIYVSKFDFNRILKTIEEKRIEKKAEIFKNNFPIFKCWSMEQLINLFNYCSQEIFNSGQFIYKQNDESEYIYFIEEGTIVQYTNVSFSWYLQFIEYIQSFENNLMEIIKNINKENGIFVNRNSGELHRKLNNIIKKIKDENNNKKYLEKYPFLNIKNIFMKRKKDLIKISELYSNEKQIDKKDNFYKIKFEENDINSYEKIYKISINTNNEPYILGLEDTFELKKRTTSVGCVSGQIKAKKIKIIDLLKILYYYREYNYIDTFLSIISQKKSILCKAIKSQMQKIGNNFEIIMNDKYEKIITQPNISSDKTLKKNLFKISNKVKNEIFVATKLKSWDNGLYLDNVLDTSLHLLSPKSSRQIKLQKNKKIKNLEKLFKTKNKSNEKNLLTIQNYFSKIIIKNPLNSQKNKKLKLKTLDKKDIKNKKERYIDNFFNTSLYPKKNILSQKTRNKKKNILFEEKKNEDNYIYIKTYDSYPMKNDKISTLTDRLTNLKKNINTPNYKKPFTRLINYKVNEDYFESDKDNNEDKEINTISYLTKEKETENVQSGISTNDKEKEKAKAINILSNDLIKQNLGFLYKMKK